MSGGLQVSLQSAFDVDNVTRAAQLIASRPGPDNAISADEIAQKLNCSPSTVRNWPQEICERFNVPVGYSENGYYRICSEEQLERELAKFESQAQRARENIHARSKAYHGTTRVVYGSGGP